MLSRPLLIGLLTLTVLRWVVAGASEVTPDEALVWLGGRQAALGFFDYGPLTSWLIRLGTWVAGDTSWGVRWFAPLFILGASVAGWRLAASAFGDKVAGWFLAAWQLMPLLNVGAVRAWPETVAFFCCLMAAWWTWQALHRASVWAWQWPAAGAAIGLAVLAAPTGFGFLAGWFVLLSVPRRWRSQWQRPGPWLALGAALLASTPWLGWLHHHQWVPWTSTWFQWSQSLSPLALLPWLGLTLLAASPFAWAGMVWASAAGLRAAAKSWQRHRQGGLRRDDPFDQKNGRVFLLCLATPGLLCALILATLEQPAIGQASFAGTAALMLLAARWVESPLAPNAHRLAQNATLLVAAAYSLLALHSDIARHLGLPWRYPLDPTTSALGWRETAAQTAAAWRTLTPAVTSDPGTAVTTPTSGKTPAPDPPSRVFLIADSPALAASLAFHLSPDLPLPASTTTTLRCHVPARLAIDSDFAWWAGYAQEPAWTGYDALFVSEVDSPPALTLLSQQFRHLERLGQVEIRRGGWPVRTLSFFACRSWRGPAG